MKKVYWIDDMGEVIFETTDYKKALDFFEDYTKVYEDHFPSLYTCYELLGLMLNTKLLKEK